MRKLLLVAAAMLALAVGTVTPVAAKEPAPQAERGLGRAAQVTGIHVPGERFPDESAVQPSREPA